MTLAEFTGFELIIPRLNARAVPGVLEELSQTVARDSRIPDWLPLYHAAWKREQLASTDLEPDMAFPHARLPDLQEVCFAFGRSDTPVRWGMPSGRPVRLVFLIAVPDSDSCRYLELISGLARLAQDQRRVGTLHRATDARELLAIFQEVVCGPGARPQAPETIPATAMRSQPPQGTSSPGFQ